MKMIYVVGQDQNNEPCRYFKIVGTEKEAEKIKFVADFMVGAYYDESLNMAFIEVGNNGITEQKKYIKFDYAAAKESWKKAKAPAPVEKEEYPSFVSVNMPAIVAREKAQTEAPAPAKVKKVRRRNRQMVKALKYCGHTQDKFDNTCEAIKRGEKNGIVSGFFLSYKRLKARKEKTMKRIARRGWSIFEIFFTPFYNVA